MSRTSSSANRAVVSRANAASVAVLDGIRVSWEWLCAAPHPVTVDGTEIVGVADRPIPLGELRTVALDPGTSGAVRDAVWSHLVGRSRRDGPTWTVACAGMGLPMLAGAYRECVARLAGPHRARTTPDDRADVASAVTVGFVAALGAVDLTRPGIASALRWAALRSGLSAVRQTLDAPAVCRHDRLIAEVLTTPSATAATASPASAAMTVVGAADSVEASAARRWESAPPPSRGGHPDLVLAAAVADGVISPNEAALIGDTRLQRLTLDEVAARAATTVGAVTMRRLRAELRLVEHLLGPQPPIPHPRATTRRRVVRSRPTTPPTAPTPPTTPSGAQSPPPSGAQGSSPAPEESTPSPSTSAAGPAGGSSSPTVHGPGGACTRPALRDRSGPEDSTTGGRSRSVRGARRRRTSGAGRGGAGRVTR